MAVKLTGDELAKVQTSRKSPRPQYYDAAAKRKQQISSDFESFLILQDPATITATLTWLGTAGTLGEIQLDRDAVAFEALVADQDDTDTKIKELTTTTLAFNAWKDSFKAGKFSDVSEVGLIIRDMQATAEELFVLEERLAHLKQVQQRVQDRIRQGVSNDQLQELLSWPTPLLTY
jgi:hypothetical protein